MCRLFGVCILLCHTSRHTHTHTCVTLAGRPHVGMEIDFETTLTHNTHNTFPPPLPSVPVGRETGRVQCSATQPLHLADFQVRACIISAMMRPMRPAGDYATERRADCARARCARLSGLPTRIRRCRTNGVRNGRTHLRTRTHTHAGTIATHVVSLR